MRIPRHYLLLLLLMMVVIGCGDGRVKLPTAPVAGTVSYQGKPLTKGRIIFFHPSGQAAAADLAPDGAFNLVAFQGMNQVAISCFETDQPIVTNNPHGRASLSPPKSLIPARYVEPGTSGLTFEVKPGGDNKATFVLND